MVDNLVLWVRSVSSVRREKRLLRAGYAVVTYVERINWSTDAGFVEEEKRVLNKYSKLVEVLELNALNIV